MDRDFCVKLTFAAHRVADALGGVGIGESLKTAANAALENCILLGRNEIDGARKQMIANRLLEEIEELESLFWKAQEVGRISSENFLVLFREYGKMRSSCLKFLRPAERITSPREERGNNTPKVESHQTQTVSPKPQQQYIADPISQRQKRILEVLKAKEKAQVWELQKVLPEVTKRTLRRDLDDLLQKRLVDRHGEWNAVFYRLGKEHQQANGA